MQAVTVAAPDVLIAKVDNNMDISTENATNFSISYDPDMANTEVVEKMFYQSISVPSFYTCKVCSVSIIGHDRLAEHAKSHIQMSDHAKIQSINTVKTGQAAPQVDINIQVGPSCSNQEPILVQPAKQYMEVPKKPVRPVLIYNPTNVKPQAVKKEPVKKEPVKKAEPVTRIIWD